MFVIAWFLPQIATHTPLGISCLPGWALETIEWSVECDAMMTSSNGKSSALLAYCAGKSQVTGEFPRQRPVTRRFYVFLDLRLNQKLSKQWGRQWFETPPLSLWRHCNATSFKFCWIFSYAGTSHALGSCGQCQAIGTTAPIQSNKIIYIFLTDFTDLKNHHMIRSCL